MKKFSYSLDGVLRVRKIQEDQTRGEIGQVLNFKNEMLRRIQQLSREIDDSAQRLSHTGVVNIQDFVQNENYQNGLRSKIAELEEKIRQVEEEIERLKLVLKERALETRKLETHKDNEKTQWRQEMLNEEQASFDEISSGRHNRS
ncbi:MAG: flagellar export protein FliJ [Lentisphaeraceae bacterium]|nr:flagellar export protein FliJ [Lentisphaeraceae bacterium]